jgi:hypothetical protein
VPAVFAVAGDAARSAGGAGKAMGRAGAVIGAAAVVAPASAGVLRQAYGATAVFRSVGGLLLLGALVVVVGIPRRDRAAPPTVPSPHGRLPLAAALRTGLLADATVRRTLGAVVATTAAVGVLAGFLPGAVERAGASPALTGGLFTAYAVVAAALMLSPLATHVDRVGPDRSVGLGLAALAAALGILGVSHGIAGAAVGVVVFGLGYGSIFPAASGAVTLAASEATRGRAFGWFNVAFSLGLALGPPIAGGLSEAVPAIDPFLTVAVVCLLAAIRPAVALAAAIGRRLTPRTRVRHRRGVASVARHTGAGVALALRPRRGGLDGARQRRRGSRAR